MCVYHNWPSVQSCITWCLSITTDHFSPLVHSCIIWCLSVTNDFSPSVHSCITWCLSITTDHFSPSVHSCIIWCLSITNDFSPSVHSCITGCLSITTDRFTISTFLFYLTSVNHNWLLLFTVSNLVSWCSEPSQSQRVVSGCLTVGTFVTPCLSSTTGNFFSQSVRSCITRRLSTTTVIASFHHHCTSPVTSTTHSLQQATEAHFTPVSPSFSLCTKHRKRKLDRQ